MKYLIELTYLGTNYHGFQYQTNHDTIQGELIKSCETLFCTSNIGVLGCSRTDSGVHAKQYYAVITVEKSSIKEENLPKALNTYLPDDIVVLSAKIVDNDYNLHERVKGKKYVYTILNQDFKNPFIKDRCFHYPRYIDIEKMNEACKYIIGKHDFASFMASGSEVDNTIRTVYECYVTNEKNEDGNFIKIYVSADGFLYNMVRIIAGTLLEISEGKIKVEDLEKIIDNKERRLTGRTLPGQGLTLKEVYID